MFGRARSYRQRKAEADQMSAKHHAEVTQLRAKVARLENALAQVVASPVEDLRQNPETTGLVPDRPSQGFAAAWRSSDPTGQDAVSDEFFETSHIDQRARSWLLTAK